MDKTNQSNYSFREKWENNKDLAYEETLREGSDIFNWILSRNGWNNVDQFKMFLDSKKRILDAGCGNGRISALLRSYSSSNKTQIVGIDIVAADIARENLKKFNNISFFKKDLLEDLSDLGKFDYIYSQEVLHHTGDPACAFTNLTDLLEPDGEIAIYVYKKKAPIREFADDFIRENISGLSYEEAMKHCCQITKLGKSLSELNMKVKIPQVDLLDIPEGEYDIQRFIYHFFMKCFWNGNMKTKENEVINYDWYHPQNCSRHEISEVRKWFSDAGIVISHECVDHYGITISGKKNK